MMLAGLNPVSTGILPGFLIGSKNCDLFSKIDA
jgi:hypothetical protein